MQVDRGAVSLASVWKLPMMRRGVGLGGRPGFAEAKSMTVADRPVWALERDNHCCPPPGSIHDEDRP